MVSYPLPIAATQPGGERKPRRARVEYSAEKDVFTKAMLELPCEYGRRNPLEWAVSLVFHIILMAALLIIPLYFTQAIDLKAFQATWLTAPAPPPPPAPPAPAVVQRVVKSVARLMQGGKMTAPSVIPRKVTIIKEEALPPDTGIAGVIGGVPGGIPGGQPGGVLGGIIGGTGSGPVAVAPPAPVKRIVRVGGNLKPPRQISAPQPIYPIIAKQAGIQGTVVIDAIIDEQGNVVQARVVDGPALLFPAALAAVQNWKYEPTRLNGEPISVEMHVEVHFVLQ